MWKRVGQMAKLRGVCRQTILRWIARGDVFDRVERTPGGQYRIWMQREPVIFLYARVSTSKQASSLVTQQALLKAEYPHGRFISDTASGFNFERRGLRAILERCLDGDPCIVVATTADRVARVGFGLIRRLVELGGGEIRLLEDVEEADDFDSAALVDFITSFIASHHGRRSARRRDRDRDRDGAEDEVVPDEPEGDDGTAARLPAGVQPVG